MAVGSLHDSRLNLTVENMAKNSTVMSYISIFIALIAISLSAYSIYNSYVTSANNQLLYEMHIQKMNKLIKSINIIEVTLNNSTNNTDSHLNAIRQQLINRNNINDNE